ncbi:DUF2442 domain-containing protein [Cyclobacterium sp.]|uniref:DUF2442 domain-containing protein n=1 Tax=Cyclobacterium sp. TaxID=1966343 RepID=UPI001993C910|nr:DUF2442 domain-containing protein [Cyclobacterium sp.]MBD3627474.1 DUF2442 domain-containing protein [Cyclobacterium sp.]
MNTSKDKVVNKRASDPIDQLIFEKGLRMKSIWFDRELDLIIVLLNNKKLLKRPLSDFKRLFEAKEEQLNRFVNNGIDIHWHDLDEDLSLRGFLKYELSKMDTPLSVR